MSVTITDQFKNGLIGFIIGSIIGLVIGSVYGIIRKPIGKKILIGCMSSGLISGGFSSTKKRFQGGNLLMLTGIVLSGPFSLAVNILFDIFT